jgi:hypothetical protein
LWRDLDRTLQVKDGSCDLPLPEFLLRILVFTRSGSGNRQFPGGHPIAAVSCSGVARNLERDLNTAAGVRGTRADLDGALLLT